MIRLSSIVLFSWCLLLLSVSADDLSSQNHHERQLQGDEPICFNGFVMDICKYMYVVAGRCFCCLYICRPSRCKLTKESIVCIDRGTLLDNNSVKTLEEPDRHTVHCLVDVPRCINSGYEILVDPEEGSNSDYGRAFKLDSEGNSRVLSLARDIGNCGTCSSSGSQTRGFRATVVGTIVPDSGMPPLLQVQELRSNDQPCTEAEGGQFSPVNITFDSGNLGGDGIDTVALHGGLMATAWGFVLPLGVLSSRFLRHRPGGLWFVLHRILNLLGVALTIGGIIVAFVSFDNVFTDGMGPSCNHGVIGLTTMTLGILQAVNGILRPHTPEEDEQKEKKRFIWELLHKCTGYATLALAYTTIYYGAQVAGSKKQDTFMGVFYATFAFAGVVAIVMRGDKLFVYKEEDGRSTSYKDKTQGMEVSSGFQEGEDLVKDAKA
jgi:hypothetical protein